MQGASISKPQGLMTPCTRNVSDVVDRSSRFSALEGMMAQRVAIVFLKNLSVIPPMEVASA
jgi:hypothetical protein